MMIGAAAREFLSPPSCSSIISFSPFAPPIKLAPFLLSNKTQNKLPLLQIPPFGNHKKSSSTITISSSSQWVSQEVQDGVWEDPDDGSDSDYEEEEEEEGRQGETVGPDVSGVMNAATVDQSEEELIKEVEQLLTQEERAILQQNEAPVLSKISTRKWNALHTLALSLQIPFMDKLLELGVDIDAVDKDGYTALHKAVMGKKEAVISHLLRRGANPHVRDKDGATLLHYAVEVGAMQTVKLLIKYKLDVNVADDEGWTPLHVAMLSRNRDIAKVLLVNGADKTRRNKDGKTPLDLSLCFGRDFKSYELAKLLKLVPANR